MVKKNKQETRDYVGEGIAVGTAVGVTLGAIFNNLGIGLATGICLGLIIGAIFEDKCNKESKITKLKNRIKQKKRY